jgi:hypothetical protein
MMEINMPAYNFKSRFVEPIQSGEKNTTIRPCRKRPTRIGDTLYLFTGQRTKACRKIGVYRCKNVTPLIIYPQLMSIYRDGYLISIAALKLISVNDGFSSLKDFFCFFRDQYGPVRLIMELITWEPLS